MNGLLAESQAEARATGERRPRIERRGRYIFKSGLGRARYARGCERRERSICPIFTAYVLTGVVLFAHLLWCAWALLGWTVTLGRPGLRALHIASIVYAIVIELVPWPPCPLTVAEMWLEARAGIAPAHEPFLVRVLDAILYPDLPEWLVVGGAVVVCVAILGVYVRRYVRRTAQGEW
jgi:hypothetical protein